MTELVVGCPLQSREWIIERWVDHVETAAVHAGFDPVYLFVGRPDDPSVQVAKQRLERLHRLCVVRPFDEPERPDKRSWREARLRKMVELRNCLLTEVRRLNPTWFLSVDSDILLSVDTIRSAVDAADTGPFDAVGSRTFLSRSGTRCPSMGFFYKRSDNGMPMRRPDQPGSVIQVDVIMAIKLMGRDAYNVDYQYHRSGEDGGWSKACTDSGLRLGWDGRTCSKHVMDPDLVDSFDERCGF